MEQLVVGTNTPSWNKYLNELTMEQLFCGTKGTVLNRYKSFLQAKYL